MTMENDGLNIISNNDGEPNPNVEANPDPSDGEVVLRMTHRYNIDDCAVFVGKEAGPDNTYDTDYVLKMPAETALEFGEGDVYVLVMADDEEWHAALQEAEIDPETNEPTGKTIRGGGKATSQTKRADDMVEDLKR